MRLRTTIVTSRPGDIEGRKEEGVSLEGGIHAMATTTTTTTADQHEEGDTKEGRKIG